MNSSRSCSARRSASIHGWKRVVAAPCRVKQKRRSCSVGEGAIRHARKHGDHRRNSSACAQRDHVVRRQKKDIGIADVVGPRERHVRGVEQEEQRAAPRPAPQHVAESDRRKDAPRALRAADARRTSTWQADAAALFRRRFITRVSRQSAFVTSNQNFAIAFAKRCRRLEICPQASEVPRVLEGSERGDGCGHQQHSRLQRIALAAGMAVHGREKVVKPGSSSTMLKSLPNPSANTA